MFLVKAKKSSSMPLIPAITAQLKIILGSRCKKVYLKIRFICSLLTENFKIQLINRFLMGFPQLFRIPLHGNCSIA